MSGEKFLFRLILAGVLAAFVTITVRSAPDLKRYIRIRRM